MYIKSLTLEGYRNLKNTALMPSKGINVICGDNAQGKTNLVECIWLFTGGRSFRGAKDKELITFGEKSSKVKILFNAAGRDQTLEINIGNNRRTAILNDVPKNYMSQIIGTFCAVVFSPNHLTLVKNGPDERRNFIDSAICQIKPSYASMLARYRRILNERNALLKDIPRHRELEDTLDIWNERLAQEGAGIACERIRYTEKLSEAAEKFYHGISDGKENLKISYRTVVKEICDANREQIEKSFLEKLQKRQNDDIHYGFTTIGIHRDDMTVRINGRDARSFGSQGQQRSAVLALKLAEAEILGSYKGEKPVILLDDVLSELDASRKNYLLNKLDDMQVFITCCESSVKSENIIFIRNGKISVSEDGNSVSSFGK